MEEVDRQSGGGGEITAENGPLPRRIRSEVPPKSHLPTRKLEEPECPTAIARLVLDSQVRLNEEQVGLGLHAGYF